MIPHSVSGLSSIVGPVLAMHPRTRRGAGWLLLLVGFGGLGVAWERATGCDLRRVRGCAWQSPVVAALVHLPHAVVGIRLLRSSSSG